MVSTLQLSGRGMTSQRTRTRLVERLKEQGIENEYVLEVMHNTPRHIFIDEALAHRAYEDTALPIGFNQTISQPYIVAKMTQQLLEVAPGNVLEIGCGSGYQMAILSQLIDDVYTVDRIKPLVVKAKKRAQVLGLDNVRFYHSDGHLGLDNEGPFDAILSAAAPSQIPQQLKYQLSDGGRMIMPVGDEEQKLIQIDRHGDEFIETVLEDVKFVPMLNGTQT